MKFTKLKDEVQLPEKVTMAMFAEFKRQSQQKKQSDFNRRVRITQGQFRKLKQQVDRIERRKKCSIQMIATATEKKMRF